MLLKTNSVMRGLSLLVGMLLATAAVGQTQTPPPEPSLDVATPYLDPAKLNPEALAAAKAQGEAMVRDMLSSYTSVKTPEMEQDVRALKRKFDDIADTEIAAERQKILDFLGIDPHADTGLYYFVSWSMPLELIRSYVVEAMWSGGTVVFKGVPPGKELGSFITTDLRALVYGKGAAANLSIDPRLFDAYAVHTVPTIVFTTIKDNLQCQGNSPVAVKVGEITASYDTCPGLDPDTYWKVTGAVTSSYALATFVDSGAEQAKPYVEALSKGQRTGAPASKEQTLFTGKWEDAISPSELLANQEATNKEMAGKLAPAAPPQ